MPLRFGLLGTGYWARETHAAALAIQDGAELAVRAAVERFLATPVGARTAAVLTADARAGPPGSSTTSER